MDHFEYRITMHAADTFTRVGYFCSERGDCSIEEVPKEEPNFLVDVLNEHGLNGWELVQLVFGKDGVMACWKRRTLTAGQ